jgi:hypothetical protein
VTISVKFESRFGDDPPPTRLPDDARAVSDLIDRGIRVDEYLTKNIVKLDNALAKFLAMAKNFAAEIEREKTSQRTHEALKVKARKGKNVGGALLRLRQCSWARGHRLRDQRGAGEDRPLGLRELRGGRRTQVDREAAQREGHAVPPGGKAGHRLVCADRHPSDASSRTTPRRSLLGGDGEGL